MHLPLAAPAVRLRARGGRLLRRRLLPGGEPDAIGEDAQLSNRVLDQRVVVFFPEPPRNAYQLEQWLRPLEELDRRQGVTLITQDSRTTAMLRAATPLTVHCVARTATLDGLVARGRLALALYVSHHPRNFQLLRYPSLAHVYLGHGESDKAVSASNQVKAYDCTFVAGQAAVDRIADELIWFDLAKLVRIGRPLAHPAERHRPEGQRASVLYAPTWEGGQPSMAYCSVPTHGEALVRSLVGAGLRVVYRPHPRTGANRRDVAVAAAALRRLFDEPAVRATGSVLDPGRSLTEAFADADLLITDISSVAVEWLPTGRPLVVTTPSEPGAVVAPSPLLDAVPRLDRAAAGSAAALVRRCLDEDPERTARTALVDHYLGGYDAGAALRRFLDACEDVLTARDAARHRAPRAVE